jgi:hypothetical protein
MNYLNNIISEVLSHPSIKNNIPYRCMRLMIYEMLVEKIEKFEIKIRHNKDSFYHEAASSILEKDEKIFCSELAEYIRAKKLFSVDQYYNDFEITSDYSILILPPKRRNENEQMPNL